MKYLKARDSSWGSHVSALEKEVAEMCGVPYAIGVASGTDALLLSLKALGVGPGDAVITVPFTFFATAGVIVNLGARPVFVDIEEAGFEMDPDRLMSFVERECFYSPSERKLVHKLPALHQSYFTGASIWPVCATWTEFSILPGTMDCRLSKTPVRPSAPHIRIVRPELWAIWAASVSSRSKNLGGAGDGGMVIASNERLADRVRLLRTHGAHLEYYHSIVGFNSRLDELQAADSACEASISATVVGRSP